MEMYGLTFTLDLEDPDVKKRRAVPTGAKRNLGPITWAQAFRTSQRVMREHFTAVKVDRKARVIESDTPIRDEWEPKGRRIALLRLSRMEQDIIASLYIGRYGRGTMRLPRTPAPEPCVFHAGRPDSTRRNRAKADRRHARSPHDAGCLCHRDDDDDADDEVDVLYSWDFQRKLARAILEQIKQELDMNTPQARAEGSPANPRG